MQLWRITGAVSVVALVDALAACDGEGQSSVFSDQFQMCSKSDTWVRPSIEEQRREIWSLPRYRGVDQERLALYLDRPVFVWLGGNSELGSLYSLHGLWTARDVEREQDCANPGDVYLGKYFDIYLLNHRAVDVILEASTYTVLVEPTERGWQHIEFWNSLYQEVPVSFRVVVRTQEGEELDSFDECVPRGKGVRCG